MKLLFARHPTEEAGAAKALPVDQLEHLLLQVHPKLGHLKDGIHRGIGCPAKSKSSTARGALVHVVKRPPELCSVKMYSCHGSFGRGMEATLQTFTTTRGSLMHL